MTEVKGLVSVTIPFYNAERYFAETIESVLAQTYSHWELLLVDDGSTDRSREIARAYAQKMPDRIFCLEHPGNQNRGPAATRNLGASRSKGEFLAFLDSDDVWLSNKLQENVSSLKANPDAGFVFGLTEWWYDWDPNQSGQYENHIPLLAPGDKLYFPHVLLAKSYPLGRYGAPCPSSYVIRREAYEQIAGFDNCFNPKTFQLYEDIAFLTKIYLNIPVFVSSLCLDRNRCNRFSLTQKMAGSSEEEGARRFFFRWLKNYFRQHGVIDPEVLRAVRKESWYYEIPMPASAAMFLRRVVNKVRRTLNPNSQ